jgi:hypothetical protein
VNDEQFTRALQSVGKGCFINYFHLFSSDSLSRESAIEKLKSETDYTEKSCISRIGHSRLIITAGLAPKAIETIISSGSSRVSSDTRACARKLLAELV